MEAYMKLMTFLVRSVEIGMASASIYERMAELLPNSSIGRRLKALANDEDRNAGGIRIKCRFDQEITDSRIQIHLEDDEIEKRMADGVAYLSKLERGLSVSDGLEKMLDFERRVEGFHSAACRQIRSPSLKRLIMILIKSNRSHIQALGKLKEEHLSAPAASRG
jgi:rubrerythrin